MEYEEYMCDDAETVIVAYGIVSRVAKSAVNEMRARGEKVGLFRPITVSPYPDKAIAALAEKPCVKRFFVSELSKGQMVEDVRLAVNGRKPVEFYGRTGGHVINTEELIEAIEGGKR